MDFGFQIGFLYFCISGFQSGFLVFNVDFRIYKWISGFQSGFLDFKVDYWISKWISGFLHFKVDSGFCLKNYSLIVILKILLMNNDGHITT